MTSMRHLVTQILGTVSDLDREIFVRVLQKDEAGNTVSHFDVPISHISGTADVIIKEADYDQARKAFGQAGSRECSSGDFHC